MTPAPAPRQREVTPSPSPQERLEAVERVIGRLHREVGPPYDRATAAREVHELTEELHPADIAHILEGLPVEDRLWVWGLVGPDREGDVLLEVSDAVRDTLL
ncbi:MAG TPA: magnesium transporter, partial [Usitatibacter sp.]